MRRDAGKGKRADASSASAEPGKHYTSVDPKQSNVQK